MVQPGGKQRGLRLQAKGFALVPKGTTGGFKLSLKTFFGCHREGTERGEEMGRLS